MAKTRLVYFTDDDAELFRYSQGLPNFSRWVKQKLATELDTGNIEALINKLIDARLGAVAVSSNNVDFSQFM